MNILLLTNCMAQPDSKEKGVPNIVFFFAKEWAKAGHNVVMIHSNSKFPLCFYMVPNFITDKLKKRSNIEIPGASERKTLEREQDGVKILRLPMMKIIPHSDFKSAQYDKQFALITQYLKKINFVPDVVTGHWREPQLKLVNRLGEFYNAKKGFVEHGVLSSLSEEHVKCIKNLDCMFFRSESVKNDMLKNDKYSFLNNQKVEVCYSGIPDEYVENIVDRTDWKKNGILKVLFVGRLIAYKRVDATLEALKKAFPAGGYEFTIVGDGAERQSLENKAKSLGILDYVNFTGRISRNEVIKKTNESDCFVMISENEVFGLVYLESMVGGCLTVASKYGGVDGIINNNENGFLCEQGNSDELAEILKKINEMSIDDVLKIRRNGYETLRNFTDSKVAEKYLNDIIG